jgi:hypothetical protein
MDLEQLEAFALGDREAALAQLVPGTEDHDYHRALLLQERGKLAEVDALLDDWRTRHGYSDRRQRIERRQLLYKLGLLDQVALDQVRDELGVELDHQADLDSERPRHPTRLAADAVDPTRLIEHATNRDSDLRGVTEEGLIALLDVELDATRRRHLLTRLGWTPHERLVALIAADLDDKSTRGFGSLAIHTKLTSQQLDALARLRPELRVHPLWVDAMLLRLRPAPHVDWQGDPAARAAYLEILVGFVRTLPAAFNSLRAHVLWHRLDHDRRTGRHDRDRFIEYLQVPRHVGYARSRWIDSVHRDTVAQVGRDHAAATGLAAVTDEEGLVRDYLHHFLATEDGRAFADWLDAHWLQRELATARLLAGDPEVERWTTLLGPAVAAALRDRVDLDLALDNPVRLAATDPVALRLDVKHVPVLTVKVFRIDQLAHFLAHGREVTTAIDLDGLTGGFEATLRFDSAPMHRVRRTIELPACGQPGTYVVELIGNGKSSRALIRKGRLRHATRIGAAGVVVTIADDAGGPVEHAAVWLGGREYRAEPDGTVTLPFSTRPGRVPMLVVGNGVAMLEQVEVPAEIYALIADVAVERESLAAGGTGRAVVRIRLTVAGAPAPVALIEEARVEIATTDGQGTTSTREQPVVLADDQEAVIEWAMPADVASVAITVRGKVRSVSEQRDVQLAETTTFEVATIHRSEEIEALYLAATAAGWVVSVLGKTGEPRSRRQVNITLRHRVVTDEITATLDTDDRGRVELGALAGVTSIAAATATTSQVWPLWARPVHPGQIRILEGGTAVTPLARDRDGEDMLARATLVELRGGAPAREASRHLRAEPAAIVAVGLAAGEYQLKLPGQPEVRISVIPPGTPAIAGWAALPTTMAQLTPRRARLGACSVTADQVRIAVLDPGPHTRVHVVATRFAPAPVGRELTWSALGPTYRNDPAIESQYVSGRDLGDEYRYVLERRSGKRRPGLLLERPGLLLNPWAVRATSTAIATAATGSAYAAMAPRMAAAGRMQTAGYGGGGGGADRSAFPTHDFVPRPPVVLVNLRPDAAGIVTIDRAALAGLGALAVTCVDPGTATNRWVALPEVTEPAKDLRLRAGLDPERHVIEKKDVIGLAAGDALTVDDLATARAEVVDTVGKAQRYLLSLNDDATLRELGFLATWDRLPDAERRTKYSKYACHELHLFLYFKDPAFFAAVIKPYLANKQPRTFVDRWLLGEDLAPYHELWRMGRLNVVERCLLLGTLTGPIADAVQRLIGDAVDLIPPDPERDGALVDALLGSSALSTEGGEIADAFKNARPADATLSDAKLDQLSLAEEQAEADDDEREGESSRRSMRARDEAPMKKMKAGRGGPGGPPAMPAAAPAASIAFDAEMMVGGAASADGPVAGDLRRREQVTQLYRGADLTQEWAENNWWHTRPAEPGPDLIAANRFWRDFAAHRAAGGKGAFLSPHLGLCTGSFAEMMCALAVIDLPFTAGAHAITTVDGRMTLRAASHALVARRQLAEVTPTDGPPILIGQNLVRADDRYDWDGAEQREKYVAGELLAGVVYTGLVAVTNPTSAPVRVDLLIQIPRGALPVAGGVATRTVHLSLEAYGTETQEYSFYFPLPGRFVHYPAHVARKGELLQWAQASTYEVVREPTEVDPTSWRHLSQRGTLEQVAGFLATANLGRIELERIAWRMKDRAWFDRITAAIAARGTFASDLWAYALRHKDARRLREWLEHQDGWLRVAGRFDRGPVAVDEAERGWHEHLEYAPLINARAHRLGARARILNDGLAAQYRDALEWIALRPAAARDHARAAHYLFTQDRLDEALALVERIDRGSAGSALQHDYLLAYAACARGDLPAARRLAVPWVEHPVDRWRHRFAALIAMLDEAEGVIAAAAAPGMVDPDSRDQRMAELAARQPAFELAVDREGVTIDHRNLPGIELRFHRMELELLFSRQPFVQSDTARFSFVDPGRLERLAFAADGRTRIPWPPGMGTGSVVVEAVAAGVRKAVAHYAHDLLVTVAHQYGQLRVARASDHAVLPATYVKVFGRQHGGAVAFYKDGYTDLRGRFDYATLSTDDLTRVERFAILVASDDAGALVVEAGPPAR